MLLNSVTLASKRCSLTTYRALHSLTRPGLLMLHLFMVSRVPTPNTLKSLNRMHPFYSCHLFFAIANNESDCGLKHGDQWNINVFGENCKLWNIFFAWYRAGNQLCSLCSSRHLFLIGLNCGINGVSECNLCSWDRTMCNWWLDVIVLRAPCESNWSCLWCHFIVPLCVYAFLCIFDTNATVSLSLSLSALSAQIIQRQLEQVEEKQRQLEERGVAVEKALRGEAGNNLLLTPSYIWI